MPRTSRSLNPPPLELRWRTGHAPLHAHLLTDPHLRLRPSSLGEDAPPWIDTGDVAAPLDFAAHMNALVSDIARTSPEFAHLRPAEILIGFTPARNRQLHGLQARVTPLRFKGGAVERRTPRGRRQRVQRVWVDGEEMLYLMSFCLPRFLIQPFDEKIVTVFHELFHIAPAFDGDLRRHGGRCSIHTHSQKGYDARMALLARAYLDDRRDTTAVNFLRLSFAQLVRRHGAIQAARIPRPKLVPIRETSA